MKRNTTPETDIPRRIVRLLSVTAISVVIAMVSLTFWMARTVDDLSVEFYQKMVTSALDDQINQLGLLTSKDTNSGSGFNWVTHDDASSIYTNIGTSTTESHYFDLSFIYSGEDQLLYAFEDGGIGSDLSLEQPYIANVFLKMVHGTILDPYDIVSGFVAIDGQLAAVAAARFKPYGTDVIPLEQLPILMNVVIFKQSVLNDMAEGLFLPNLSVSFQKMTSPNAILVPLSTGLGTAHLTWEQPATGRVLLTRSLGAIAAVCLLTALGHLFVGRITMRLAKAFLRESHEARNDRLTGLLNRAGFEEEIDNDRIIKAMGFNRLALILLDMDRFKEINDTFGHAAGDKALQAMSERLRAIVRRNDIVARMGGDEFMILIIDDNPKAVAAMTITRLAKAGQKPVDLGNGIEVIVEASMGAAVAKAGSSMRQLMMAADSAMYEAKTARAFLQDAQESTPNYDIVPSNHQDAIKTKSA